MKYSGKIAYSYSFEKSPGIWEERIIEKPVRGDVITVSIYNSQRSDVIDDINISNKLSIVASPSVFQNIGTIVYITLKGIKWKVKDISIEYPRLILSIGGVYNGPGPESD